MAERIGGRLVVKGIVEPGGGAVGEPQSGDGASGDKGGSVAGWLAKTFRSTRE